MPCFRRPRYATRKGVHANIEGREPLGLRPRRRFGSSSRPAVHPEAKEKPAVRMRETVKIKSPEKRARIGERIKISATSSGLTLKELAAKANTTPALIYQYVRGITNVPRDTLQAIAAATNVNIEFFDPDKDT